MKLFKITSAKKRSTVSKTIKLIIVLVLLNSTANASTKLYNKLNSLFNSDKAKCLEVSKLKIKKNTKDPAPYIFALKCELELCSLSDRDMFYESNPDIVKDLSNRTQRMCRYGKDIERLADEEIQCSSGYLVDAKKLCEIIKNVGKKYYSARGKSVSQLIEKIKSNLFSKVTLGGCFIEKINESILIFKEN